MSRSDRPPPGTYETVIQQWKTVEDRRRLAGTYPNAAPYAERLLSAVEKNPADPSAVIGLHWAVA